jgi:hypothetical protein
LGGIFFNLFLGRQAGSIGLILTPAKVIMTEHQKIHKPNALLFHRMDGAAGCIFKNEARV